MMDDVYWSINFNVMSSVWAFLYLEVKELHTLYNYIYIHCIVSWVIWYLYKYNTNPQLAEAVEYADCISAEG